MSAEMTAETDVEAGRVRTNGIETYYERRGDGPPVVFVHAAVMDHSMWDAQVGALADEYTAVVYDLRGHGRTGGSDREPYAVDLYVEDLEALLSALDVDRPVLCGHSLGGLVASAYAARHPGNVAGLVLASTFSPHLDRPSERLQLGFMRLAVPLVRVFGIERVQRFNARLFERVEPGAAGEYGAIERLQAEAPPITYREFAKTIRVITRVRDVEIDYGAIAAPTLVLYGENEPGFLRRQARLLADLVPDADLQEVPDAGHGSNVDNPACYTTRVEGLAERAFGKVE